MNGEASRRRSYFLADKPEPDPDVEPAGAVPGGNGKPLGTLGNGKANGSAYGAEAKQPAKVKLTEAQLDKLIERMKDEYQAGWNKDRDNQEEAYRDLRMIGDDKTEHWDADALTERTDEGRPALIVNQVPQFVRQVTGDMRQMKPAIKVVPIDDAASKEIAAKVLPGMIRYIEQRSNAQHIYFAGADQQAGCGIGHWRVTHEYASQNTFAQEIRIDSIPDGVAVVWDPDAVRIDRSDAMFCFVPVDMERKKFERLYPDATPDVLSPQTPAAFTAWLSDDHVRISEWYYIDPEKKLLALYPTGAIDDVTDDLDAQQVAKAAGAQLQERDGHCVWRALVTANEIIEGPEKWPGPDIPIVPLIGEEVQIGRATIRRGVVRGLRDVQRIYNYAISTKTELIALAPKSPWIGTREQFEKYVDQWETANRRNWPYLEYSHVNGVPPPQRNDPSTNTQSLDGLTVEMQGAMNANTGIYPAALGAKSNETSGVAIRARQNEGDTGTFVYVSNFGSAIQRTGQIIVNMIPQIYDTKRTIQIAGEDGKIDQLPINQPGFSEDGSGPGIGLNDVTVGAYQVAVEMGASYSTKREEARDGMTEMMRTLGPQGASIFMDLFIKAQDWPLADKIAERAKFLLPPAIAQKEAAESGEPPPPPPPPPPPTPEQQKAMAMELQKMQEQQQSNIELARKNELEDAKLQFEKAKFLFETQTLPEIIKLQDQVRAEQVRNGSLTLQLEATKVGHEMDKGTIQFENLGLKHAAIRGAEESDAALTERVQENINTAQANEIAKQNHDLEQRKIDLEHRKLTHGAMTDEQMAQERLAEQKQKTIELAHKNEQANRQTDADRAETVQGNIEKARTNEIAARNAELEHRKIDLEHQKLTQGGYVDANEQRQANIEKARSNELAGQQFEHAKTQSQRDEERSKREHEVAMKPPTPAAAAAPARAPADEPKASAALGGDMADHPAISEIRNVVSDLSEKVHAPKPDHMPALIEVLGKLANQRKPIGTTRTKDGLRLVFDETPKPKPL